jgi:hypothetical protein
MFERFPAPLLETLRPHFALSKSRLEALAVLLVGLANCRTVNLSHLASQFPGAAKHSSNYRRLQRFFQFVQLDGCRAADHADAEPDLPRAAGLGPDELEAGIARCEYPDAGRGHAPFSSAAHVGSLSDARTS